MLRPALIWGRLLGSFVCWGSFVGGPFVGGPFVGGPLLGVPLPGFRRPAALRPRGRSDLGVERQDHLLSGCSTARGGRRPPESQGTTPQGGSPKAGAPLAARRGCIFAVFCCILQPFAAFWLHSVVFGLHFGCILLRFVIFLLHFGCKVIEGL